MQPERKQYGKVSDCPLSEDFCQDLLEPFLEKYQNERSRKEKRRQIQTICAYFYHTRQHSYEFHMLNAADAKEYFLSYLSSLCEKGEISYDTFCNELSAARTFGTYLEKRIDFLRENNIGMYLEYRNPFTKIVRPSRQRIVKTSGLLTDRQLDDVLFSAKDFDEQIYIIFLLSFRMMLSCSTILALDRSMFSFVKSGNSTVGILSYAIGQKQYHKRLPADIVADIKAYHEHHADGPFFLNKAGRRMNTTNLFKLLQKMEEQTGVHVRISELRSKGILDLVAHNPKDLDEISEYTGLSMQWIEGYGNALNTISESCIADNSSYHILQKEK